MQDFIDWDDFKVLYEPLVMTEKGSLPPEYLQLLEHREQGYHYKAIDALWKLNLGQTLQDLIHSRLLFEINKFSRSRELLSSIKDRAGVDELLEFELWFHEFDPASLEESYISFRQLLAKPHIAD